LRPIALARADQDAHAELSIELAPLGITVNSIAPGAIETPSTRKLLNDPGKAEVRAGKIFRLKRFRQAGGLAGLRPFSHSSDADYVTETTYFVDGGLTWNYESSEAIKDYGLRAHCRRAACGLQQLTGVVAKRRPCAKTAFPQREDQLHSANHVADRSEINASIYLDAER